jgi:hypothetical protein
MLKFVQVVFNTPTGMFVAFLPAEGAVQIGQAILDSGRQARSGLTIATAIQEATPDGFKGRKGRTN